MIIKVCQFCGKEFKANRKSQKYCCKQCAVDALKKTVEVVCKYCGKKVNVNPYKAKEEFYCSIKCAQKARGERIKKRITVKCAYCGKDFITTPYHTRKYCSKECRYKAAYKGNTINKFDDYAELIISSKKFGEKRALISLEDIDKVKTKTWQAKYTKDTKCFYVVSSQSNNAPEIKLHRYLLNCPPDMVVDHINHNPLDNRRENLRITTQKVNANNVLWKNKKLNKSGYRGIHCTKSGKYTVTHNKINLGTYKTIEEAIKVKQDYLTLMVFGATL